VLAGKVWFADDFGALLEGVATALGSDDAP